jgi:hypothetical protein
MLRQSLAHNREVHDRGFRWRSHEISRIEGLSDAVFAFAVTLLIVSLEVPRTFAELSETLHGFVPFAISFAMLIQIWYAQFVWFRRYGLQDSITITLNSVLLFVILFYVYPLKFLFTYLINISTGGEGLVHLPDGRTEPMLQGNDAAQMMLIYNAGFIAVFLLFVLLYFHAWRRREALELDRRESFLTIERLGANVCFVAIGLLSTAVVVLGGSRGPGHAGMVYMLIAPVLTLYYRIMGGRFRRKGFGRT